MKVDRRTDGQTFTAKLSGAFRNCFAKFPKINKQIMDSENEDKKGISMFHRAFFNSIIDKTPTHALFNQHCINLAF